MRNSILCLSLGLMGFVSMGRQTDSCQVDVNASISDDTGPDVVFRDFLRAMGAKDEAKLRSLSVPQVDFEWLLKGQAVPDEMRKEFESFVNQAPIRKLKAGETIEYPGRPPFKVEPGDISDTEILLMFGRDPLPHKLRKIDGQWKVDPTALISARKAADAARRKKASQ